MNGLNVQNTNDKLIMSIDKENFSESVLLKVMKIASCAELLFKEGATNCDSLYRSRDDSGFAGKYRYSRYHPN